MASQKQLSILRKGVPFWNDWRLTYPQVEIDLSSADLRDTNLQHADFIGANLSEANLTNTNLHNANFTSSNLTNTRLIGANLIETCFSDSLMNCADLNHAMAGNTIFAGLDLSSTQGLTTVSHVLPSHISTHTFYKSRGKIPINFLRGCGLSDLDIEYVSLTAPGLDHAQVKDITNNIYRVYRRRKILYYSCFISYNNKDAIFTNQLYNDLQNNGVRCWFYPEDIKIGDLIRKTINDQIRARDKLLLVISKNSLKDNWIADQVEAAAATERESDRLVIFPIRLDDAIFDPQSDWPEMIKNRRHIGNFSHWKNQNSYQIAFEKLLKDLRAANRSENDSSQSVKESF
jgi:hypothetical protein